MTDQTQLGESSQALVNSYDCAMLDLDGVVYVGPHAVEGVPELLARARAEGMRLAFVTNNAARTPESVAAHLRELDIEAGADDVVTSAQAAAREVAKLVDPGSRVLVVGGEGLEEALCEHGVVPVRSADDEPAAVVQGYHPDVGWRQLAEAAVAIHRGVPWVASNVDLTVPTARGLAPGNGTLVNAVAAAVGHRPAVVAGKPFRPLFDETVRRVGAQRPLVVGDRLDTDIEGAVEVGADSLLLMTGVTDLVTLCMAPAQRRPTYVGWTMDALMRSQAQPSRDGEDWTLAGWSVTVSDGRIDVHDRGHSDDDGLRCVVGACWAWHDSHPRDELRRDDLEKVWSHG